MSDSFVPLLSSMPAGAALPATAKVTLVSDPGQNFAPFHFPEKAGAAAASAPGAGQTTLQPAVRFKREGDRIVGFQIECACGQVYEFACVY